MAKHGSNRLTDIKHIVTDTPDFWVLIYRASLPEVLRLPPSVAKRMCFVSVACLLFIFDRDDSNILYVIYNELQLDKNDNII